MNSPDGLKVVGNDDTANVPKLLAYAPQPGSGSDAPELDVSSEMLEVSIYLEKLDIHPTYRTTY